MTLEGFEQTSFSALGETRDVYRAGEGPGVLVMHEIPGLTPQVAGFARRVVEAGFTVAMPDMFGKVGKKMSGPYAAREILRACVAEEFAVFARHDASPITDWLRVLMRDLHQRCGGPGVGAIGMCLTGNFALALVADDALLAPVLSQPSLPFGITADHKRSLHVPGETLAIAKRRARDQGLKVLGLRFSHDFMCPKQRFDSLRTELGPAFEAIEVDSGPGNAHGIPRTAHSVVTVDLVDEEGHPTRAALDRVLAFFDERLRPAS